VQKKGKTMKYLTVGLLILVTSSVLMSQDTTTQNMLDMKAAIAELKASPLVSKKPTRTAADVVSPRSVTSGSTVSSVVATDVTVAANSLKIIDQTQIPFDFSGAENLSVSVISPTSLNSVLIAVSWAPYLANFATTNVIDGSTFKAGSTGGAQVPVFAPNLVLAILNNGSTAITIHQLAIYAYVH
jgi:hypothetical protein